MDAPPSIGAKNILAGIAEVTGEKLAVLIYSHKHADHIGAAADFPGTFRILSSVETSNLLKRRQARNRTPSFGIYVGRVT